MSASIAPLKVGVVLFAGFNLLDVVGPVEMLAGLGDRVHFTMLAEKPGAVRSAEGPEFMADAALAGAVGIDVLLVPGGSGTRREVANEILLAELRRLSGLAFFVTSVCTGSALLAKSGVLDGRQATSNKRAFAWAVSQGPQVRWVAEARWVEDGKFFTSSGVSAGMDMALGLIARITDRETSVEIANRTEYAWHEDKGWDPFAKLNGLT